jgi:mono/diheme cytochrome c family protein
MKTPAAVALALVVAGCRTEQTIVAPDPHLERMIDQPKAMPYGEAPLLPEGMTMQQPPDGTLSVDAVAASEVTTGLTDHAPSGGGSGVAYATRVPIPVDRALLETGRTRFETICAACHGILGDGTSVVATHMALRKPPSLLVPPASTDAVGEQFQTVVHGYGLMPSYRVQLSDREAWAVVAYLQALRLARRARVSDLPPDVRERLALEAP